MVVHSRYWKYAVDLFLGVTMIAGLLAAVYLACWYTGVVHGR